MAVGDVLAFEVFSPLGSCSAFYFTVSFALFFVLFFF